MRSELLNGKTHVKKRTFLITQSDASKRHKTMAIYPYTYKKQSAEKFLLYETLTVLKKITISIVSERKWKNKREDVVQCHIRKASDRCDTKVCSYVGCKARNELLVLAERASDLGLISSVEESAAFELQGHQLLFLEILGQMEQPDPEVLS
jgi:hypothetical protein